MKKSWYSVMLVFAGVLFLAACAAQAPIPATGSNPAQVVETAAATAEPLPSATVVLPTIPVEQPTAQPVVTESPEPTAATASETPVEAQATQQADTPAAACVDAVQFVDDVTIPDYSDVAQSKPFVKTWRVRNSGSCPWGPNYQLTFLSGEQMGAAASIPLPVVPPGENGDISIPMTAPNAAGGYTSNWQFMDPQGNRIAIYGSSVDWIWLKVNVPAIAQQSAPVAVVTSVPTAAPADNAPAAPTPVPAVPAAPVVQGCSAVTNGDFENQVLALINQQRATNGAAPLKRSSKLDAAALAHSLDMGCQNFVDHFGQDGSTWFTRIAKQGYKYSYASENIAAGNPAFGGDASWVVMVRWMTSQVHRENILNPNVTEIGISFVYNATAQWGGYTTVDFAKP